MKQQKAIRCVLVQIRKVKLRNGDLGGVEQISNFMVFSFCPYRFCWIRENIDESWVESKI